MHKNQPTQTAQYVKSDIPADNPVNYDMIVFCHLRWDFVYQRPQHIINRMSEQYNILFIEEPIGFLPGEENTAELITVNENLSVLKPKVNSIADIKYVLPMYVANTTVKIGWFYSSAFVYLLNNIEFETVVYDCMDELTLFKGAPELLKAQEIYLLSEADIVFTGGKSLYEAKKQVHDNVYCFPSSVDRKHFEQALNGIMVPDDLPKGKQVVGYYGVIDERIDTDLLKAVSEKMPDVDFVMIGPVVKIDEAQLPKAANLHYLGMKSYKMLPHYLKGFDVAMMPFAINDSTRFISPTKTLEYMAANKPVVSTPVYDVVRDYQDSVSVINNADEFCDAVSNILKRSKEEEAKLQQKFEAILDSTSWDKTVKDMQQIILKNKAHE